MLLFSSLHVTFVIAKYDKAEFMTKVLVYSKNLVKQITLMVNHKC